MRKRAFTIAELMLAIFIIALLVGMLLPALRRIRDHAHSTQCKSNLRQIGLAIHEYAIDYADRPPPVTEGTFSEGDSYTSTIYEWTYTEFSRFYLYTAWVDEMEYGRLTLFHSDLRDGDGFLSSYMDTHAGSMRGILGCPAVPQGPILLERCYPYSRQVWQGSAWQGMSYMVNGYGLADRYGRLHCLSSIERPGELVLMSECAGIGFHVLPPNRRAFLPTELPEAIHSGRFNAVFLDGHTDDGTLESLYTVHYFVRE